MDPATERGHRLERRAAALALLIGALLLAVKLAAYLWTGSSAIFSDAMESIVNVLAAGFALRAIALAHRPADAQHPYGHGKVEFLSAGFEGGMLLLAAALILLHAGHALVEREAPVALGAGAALILTTAIVNAALGGWLVRVGRRHGALSLEADGLHLVADAVSSGAVLAALLGVRATGWWWIDPVAAMLVAAYVLRTGATLLRRSFAGLMDEQDAADARLLGAILDRHTGPDGEAPLICSYHKVRHRHSGRYHWVDFHLVVPASLDVRRGHEIASAIEHEIEQQIAPGNATAHVEPCRDAACPLCGVRSPALREL